MHKLFAEHLKSRILTHSIARSFSFSFDFNEKYTQTLDYDAAAKMEAVAHAICMFVHRTASHFACLIFFSTKKPHYRAMHVDGVN